LDPFVQRAAVVDDRIRVLKERLIIQEVERKRSEQNNIKEDGKDEEKQQG